jgi:hypothetical protein
MAKATRAASRRKAGYKDHIVGSRKGKVHELYDADGADAAFTLGRKLGLRESTLRTWMATWRRADAKSKARTKKTAKAA